jgi:predicted ATPase
LFDGGAACAELGALTDGALVGGAIAAALDVETLGADLSRELVQVLAERKALIVLDNAEHLVEDVARLVHALVEGTSQVVLVVTSQAPLKLRCERVYRLGPLDVPETVVAVDEARSYGAVALFEDRAQAADRRFALSERNVGTVIDICRHLDGVPLAIELAAARVPLLGVAQLSSALEERLRVLSSRDSAVPRRQQTLRAALEWSHGLLGAQEQIVFRRLAVFAGSFSLSLAKQVVTDEGCESLVDEWAFLDGLGVLIDRSLVVADSAEVPRYRLLESARAFALELLLAANEEAGLRLRHARVIRAHFEGLDAARWDGSISIDDVLAQLEPDLDNAREAMSWTLRHEPPLAVALWAEFCFALTRSRFLDQAREWEITGQLLTNDVPVLSRAKWHRRFAQFWGNRNPQTAATSIRTALELHRTCGATREIFLDLQIFCWLNRGKLLDERDSALEEMRRLENPDWSPAMKFRLSNAKALLCIDKGDFDTAIVALRRSLELAESAGDSQARRSSLLKLAECELSMGRIDDALRRCMDLEQRLTGTRHRWDLSLAQALILSARLAKNDTERARDAARAGWSLACQIGMGDEWGDKLALLAALEGRPRHAARLIGYADASFAASGATRRASDAHAEARALMLTRARLDCDDFARLRGEGATLSESDIEAIAFSLEDGD